jgi:hypothetical protein
MTTDPYPEHAKQRSVLGVAQTLGEFLEWLDSQGVHLTQLREVDWAADPKYMPDVRSKQQMLADYFGIDLNAIEQEKRAMLASIRAEAKAADR